MVLACTVAYQLSCIDVYRMWFNYLIDIFDLIVILLVHLNDQSAAPVATASAWACGANCAQYCA